MWGEEDVHTSAWDLKRKQKVCNLELKVEIRWSLKRRGKVRWSLKQRGEVRWSLNRKETRCLSSRPVSFSCVFSGRRTISQKGSQHRRKIGANSLWLYSYYTQSSPSKNKNINYICIYLRVFRCVSSGAIYTWNYIVMICFRKELRELTSLWKVKIGRKKSKVIINIGF